MRIFPLYYALVDTEVSVYFNMVEVREFPENEQPSNSYEKQAIHSRG